MGKAVIVDGVFWCDLCRRIGGKYEASFIRKNIVSSQILFEDEFCADCAFSIRSFMDTLKPKRITEKELLDSVGQKS